MARITVEDCINKVKSAYELVLIAKERAVQLNSGDQPNVDRDNDKNKLICTFDFIDTIFDGYSSH